MLSMVLDLVSTTIPQTEQAAVREQGGLILEDCAILCTVHACAKQLKFSVGEREREICAHFESSTMSTSSRIESKIIMSHQPQL